jgi:all-trans-8'-apo-beta-carotenal 15,15'-oxygenase
MSVADRHTTTSATWRLGFQSLQEENPDPVDLEVEGSVPVDLAGTLYRIGPARHEVHGDRNGSWFDGDGMVHALRFAAGRVSYRNRFVRTRKMADEDAAGQRRYGGLGSPSPVGGLRRLRQFTSGTGNPANTNIVAHGGTLLALCEAGRPYRLDPVTLETLGVDDLGAIPEGETFGAHAKQDPATGELWNIGFRRTRSLRMSLYRRDLAGRTSVLARVPLPFNTVVHDFALTPTKAVIVVHPLVMAAVPVGILSKRTAVLDLFHWAPNLGTRIVVVDRTNGELAHYATEAFLLHHTANAFDEGDDVILDLCAYPDDTIHRLFRAPLAGTWPEVRHGWPERFRLTRSGRVHRRRISDGPFEFPRVAPSAWLSEHRHIYGVSGYLGQPISLDTETGRTTQLWHRPAEHAGEPIPVPKPGARADTDIWLLTIVLTTQGRSELRIFDGSELDAPPVARVRLPHFLPFDFHGNWLPENGPATLS